jgi:2-C-methyl-D-erythritol 4-phosphate cytidylyltransferase
MVPRHVERVVIHDAAHPLVSPSLVAAVLHALEGGADGAVPIITINESLARLDATGALSESVPKAALVSLQMPQAFVAAELREVHQGEPQASDDATLCMHRGRRIATVPGDPLNLHVTTADDLAAVIHVAMTSPTGERMWR